MAQVRKAPGRICIRIASGFDFKIMCQGGHERILAAAGKHGVPVMIYPGGEYPALTNYVSKSTTSSSLLTMSLWGWNARLYRTLEATIDQLVACSKYPNVAVKWGPAPPGSHANLFHIAT